MRLRSYIIYISIATLLTACSLECPSDSDQSIDKESAVIPVAVDWSSSGLTILETKSDESDVHRLSLRFFPSDGDEPFERYLERNLYEDNIEVPVGTYSVVAINESISDSYWSGAMIFTNSDSYELFSAELHTDDGSTAAETYALVAWSIPSFEITQAMANYTRGVIEEGELSQEEQEQMTALTNVVMEPRTRTLRVNLSSDNIASSQSVTASVSGLSMRVNIVSGVSEPDPISHTFELTSYSYNSASRTDTSTSGIVSGEKLCFAHSDDHDDGYTLDLEVYLNDGTQHVDEEQLSGVDIEDQVTSTEEGADYEISHSISLPLVEGGSVELDEWSDGGIIELN